MKEKGEHKRIPWIYREYIEPSSPMEVNINDNTKQAIVAKITSSERNYDLSVFDDAVDELVILIKESILSDFLTEYASNVSSLAR